jgi:hypothetical protein
MKVTLLPSNKKDFLGTDTLYFAIEPSRSRIKNSPKEPPGIKLIKYEHKEAPKKH